MNAKGFTDKTRRLAKRLRRRHVVVLGALAVLFAGGCGGNVQTPIVVFLDGASHFSAGGSIKSGLRAAGYRGTFQNFVWTSFLGYGADHFIIARSKSKARSLTRHIERIRRENPDGEILVMGLSAGTALVMSALEQLPDDTQVDHVVLFSSSVSASRNLTPVLKHVRGRLYATCSPHDLILAALPTNADGRPGPPAGRTGFRIPRKLTAEQREAYHKVVNLRWKPSYVGFGWNGGHVRATASEFVRAVIAPRVLSSEPFPLDRPLAHAPKAKSRAEDESETKSEDATSS